MSATARTIGAVACVLWLAASAGAQQLPQITNGTITMQPAGSPFVPFFQRLVAQTDVAWVGYSVPVAEGHELSCDSSTRARATGTVRLEGGGDMAVLFRVVDHHVERVRAVAEQCELDAGGRPVNWLQNVNPVDSVRLLESIAIGEPAGEGRGRAVNGALVAMALHGGAARDVAGDVMIRLARTGRTSRIRSEALFWLAQMAGDKAVGAITEAIERDPDTQVKRTAVFALSQLSKEESVPLLIKVARTNNNPAVRKQAMFWLGQSKDPRAVEFFAEILKER